MASSGLKIALVGCAVVVVIGIVVMVAGGLFLKKKVEQGIDTLKNVSGTEDSEYGKKAAELTKEYPFTPPANGVITEDQLVRFLEVRKKVYGVYKKYETEFKKLSESKEQGLSSALQGISFLNELRMTQIQALEDLKMSPEEYEYIVTSVYKSWFAKGAKESLKHDTYTDAASEQLQKSIDELDKQIQDPNTSEDVRKQLEGTKESLRKQQETLSQNRGLQELDEQLKSVPQENIDLFTRHEEEIRQYAMSGLELFGM